MEKQTRRAFLGSLIAAGALTACGSQATSSTSIPTSPGSPTSPAAPPSKVVPLTIDLSQSNLPANMPAYAYIIGSCPNPKGETVYYRLDSDGGIHPLAYSDNVPGTAGKYAPPAGITLSPKQQTTMNENYPQDWADYSIPLTADTSTTINLGGIENIPGIGEGGDAFSGRIFISVGYPKLPFTVQTYKHNGVTYLTYASPAFTVGAPGAQCMYDWIEFSLTNTGILDCNTTQVDQFGLPLTVSAMPTTSVSPQGALVAPRTTLMQNIHGLHAPLDQGVTVSVAAPQLYPAGLSYLRALSPVHISASNLGSSVFNTYFDALITQWYETWAGNPLTVTVQGKPTKTYQGTVVGGNLTFEGGLINYGPITTADIWQCDGTLAQGNAPQPDIGNEILSAFNRGVMSNSLTNVTCPAVDTYYPTGGIWNLWARKWHEWNLNGYAYGFAYDDNCGQSTTIVTSGQVTSMTITLGEMSS